MAQATRITNSLRDQMVSRLLQETTIASVKKLKKELNKTAVEYIEAELKPYKEKMDALPEDFFPIMAYAEFAIDDYPVDKLKEKLDGLNVIYGAVYNITRPRVSIDPPMRLPSNMIGSIPVKYKDKFGRKIYDLCLKVVEQESLELDIIEKTRGILKNIRTLKQLKEMWPDGEKYLTEEEIRMLKGTQGGSLCVGISELENLIKKVDPKEEKNADKKDSK